MANHMRRSKGRDKPGGGGAVAATTPPLSFSIPLKDTSKPVAFPGSFQKHIALEFAMRYLSEVRFVLYVNSMDIGYIPHSRSSALQEEEQCRSYHQI